ncbi:MAG: spermine/spermidine synthase domain-containing protein [Bdellovibrionota bacterium]
MRKIIQDLSEKIRWRDVLGVGLGMTGLLLSEFVVNRYITYCFPSFVLAFIPILVFAGISVGNILGLLPRFDRPGLSGWLLITAGLTAVSLVCIAKSEALRLYFVAPAFVGYGVFLSLIIAVISIESLVLGLSVGGILLYAGIAIFFSQLAPYLTVLCVILPLLSALFLRVTRWELAAGILVGGLSLFGALRGVYEPNLFTQHLSRIKGAPHEIPPIETPLIRTDLVRANDGNYVIITNGRRFAHVTRQYNPRKHLDDGDLQPAYALPYYFARPKKVLVIGSAEGANIFAALKYRADEITAVEINPAVFELMKGRLEEFTGGLYTDPKVRTVVSEGRHFVETTKEKFDLITLQGVQTGTLTAPVSLALLESYLMTEEALKTLWDRLEPDGEIWIEEYEVRLNNGNRQTLISQVEAAAKKVLPFQDFARQHGRFRYQQPPENISGDDRRWREGLLLSKRPLTELTELPPEVSTVPTTDLMSQNDATDNRPFWMRGQRKVLFAYRVGMWLTLALFFFTLLRLFSTPNPDSANNRRRSEVALFSIGAGFILLIAAASGPLGLLLGEPQLSTPLLFLTTYSFGLVGGLLALRCRASVSKWSLGALSLMIVLLAVAFTSLKPVLISAESSMVRVLILVALIAPLAVLAELPYIWLLKGFEGSARARAFAIENLGTLVGVPAGLWLQVKFGFIGTMLGAASAYAIALLAIALPEARAVFVTKRISALLSFFFVAAAFISFRGVPSIFLPMGPVEQTADCEEILNSDEIEVSFHNAIKLERKGIIQVTVGPGEGCYRKGATLPLAKIKREAGDRKIIFKQTTTRVRVGEILRMSFGELNPERQIYVRKKFGESAEEQRYDILTLIDEGRANGADEISD